mgnify:CR=1 FL=1
MKQQINLYLSSKTTKIMNSSQFLFFALLYIQQNGNAQKLLMKHKSGICSHLIQNFYIIKPQTNWKSLQNNKGHIVSFYLNNQLYYLNFIQKIWSWNYKYTKQFVYNLFVLNFKQLMK